MTNQKRILVIDDDADFAAVLQQGLIRNGFDVNVAATASDAQSALSRPIDGVTLDLNLGESVGLRLIPDILEKHPQCKIVVITGYASIQSAVHAIKMGAAQYLPKPVKVRDVVSAFGFDSADPSAGFPAADLPADGVTPTDLSSTATVASSSLSTLEWEQILEVLQATDFNITKAAQQLGISRRTLQRKLKKKEFFF